jgi:hypothetical protein
MSKQIVFKINNEGNVSIASVEGYGSSCMDVTKAIETVLGLTDEKSRKLTHEYDDPVSTDNSEHIQA